MWRWTLLTGRFTFYRKSSLNRSMLKRTFDTLDRKHCMLTWVGGTRWLPHTLRALENLWKAYPAIIIHLQQLPTQEKPSAEAENAIGSGSTDVCSLPHRCCRSVGETVIVHAEREVRRFWRHDEGARNIVCSTEVQNTSWASTQSIHARHYHARSRVVSGKQAGFCIGSGCDHRQTKCLPAASRPTTQLRIAESYT